MTRLNRRFPGDQISNKPDAGQSRHGGVHQHLVQRHRGKSTAAAEDCERGDAPLPRGVVFFFVRPVVFGDESDVLNTITYVHKLLLLKYFK